MFRKQRSARQSALLRFSSWAASFKYWFPGVHGGGARWRFQPSDKALVYVVTRADGAVTLRRDRMFSADAVAVEIFWTEFAFGFASAEAADSVLAKFPRWLNDLASNSAGWLSGVTTRQVAEAVKTEASDRCHDFDVVYVRRGIVRPVA